MTPSAGTDTRLLRTAERLFAERGVGAVSLRAVMQEAGTNVAAVHYHFGSKEVLLEAVVRSRIGQVTDARNALLDALSDGTREVDARSLALAFIRPVLDVIEGGGRDWVRLIGRLLATNDPALAPISQTFYDRNARFVDLITRLDPQVTTETIAFRLAQAMTMSLQVLGDVDRVRALMGGDDGEWKTDQVIDQLVDVVASILAGPDPRSH